MRLLYVTTSLPYGAREAFAIPELLELLERGHEILIIHGGHDYEVAHGDAAALVPHAHRLPPARHARVMEAVAQAMRSPIGSLESLTRLVRGGKRARLRKNLSSYMSGMYVGRIAQSWGADHIHGYWASSPATIALVAAQVSGIPWSFAAHRADILQDNLLRLKIRRCRFVRFISNDGVEIVRSMGIPGLERKAQVLHLGVEVPDGPAPHDDRDEHDITILSPGWLIPRKGHGITIEAMAMLRDRGLRPNLHIAGQGELLAELQAKVSRLSLENQVRFLGQVPHEELLERYREGSVQLVVLASLHEGIPVSLMEAMAHGVPVIGTAVGGTPELLADGAGTLIPPEDPARLADAVERLMRSPKLRSSQAERARRRIRDEYSVDHTVDRLLELYAQG